MSAHVSPLDCTQLAVQSQAEIPSGYFAWGCGVLENKSLRIDQVSALPLVHNVTLLVDPIPNKRDQKSICVFAAESCQEVWWDRRKALLANELILPQHPISNSLLNCQNFTANAELD